MVFHGEFFMVNFSWCFFCFFFCGQSMSKLIEIGWIGVWGWSRMVNIEDKDGPEICVTTTHGGPESVEVTLPRSPQLSAKLHHCFFFFICHLFLFLAGWWIYLPWWKNGLPDSPPSSSIISACNQEVLFEGITLVYLLAVDSIIWNPIWWLILRTNSRKITKTLDIRTGIWLLK